MKRFIKTIFAATFITSLSSGIAVASIIGGAVTGGAAYNNGGTFVELDPTTGFSIGYNNFDDWNLYAFNEDQNISITSAINVNIGTNPVAGDIVASHYIGYDPGSFGRQIGYIDFDADIYGIATTRTNLDASDYLANTSVTYLSDSLRGLESGDNVWIDANLANRLWVDWSASTPGDYVRVFTQYSELAAVPLPASGLLLLGGVLGLAGMRRKRRG